MSHIQSAFKFSDDDLVANRAGWATEQQVRQSGQAYGCGYALVGAVAAGLLVFACAAGFVMLVSWFVFDRTISAGGLRSLAQPLDDILFPFVLGIGFLGFLILLAMGTRRDRREQRVVRCTGPFRIESRFLETNSLTKTLHVDGRRFKIDPFQSRALRPYQGRHITVYYFSHSRQIASVEIST